MLSVVLLINQLRETLCETGLTKKRTSIRLSNDLATELLEASIKVNEVVESLEVQLDKETMRKLKLGERQYSRGQFKVAKNTAEIDTIFAG